MNKELTKIAKNDFEKNVFNLENTGVFAKTMSNAKNIDISNL